MSCLLLEAGDQFAVGGDQRLLGFDLGDDGLLRGEGWEGILNSLGFDSMLEILEVRHLIASRTGLE